MDHMLELARHPDLPEALERLTSGCPAEVLRRLQTSPRETWSRIAYSAQRLAAKQFLAAENPNAWVTEVVHVFYDDPDFAAAIWVELRGCHGYLRDLAERKVWAEPRGKFARLIAGFRGQAIGDLPKDYLGNPQKAIREYAKKLRADPDLARQIAETFQVFPEPPAFIRDLVDSEKPKRPNKEWYAKRDTRIRELLADPGKVRQCACKKGIPVPFSLVQEQELQQICHTRTALRPRAEGSATATSAEQENDEAPGSSSLLAYQRSPYSEWARRMRRRLRRSAMEKTERSAQNDVMEGKYSHHAARVAMDMNLVGLAFSGGGIRSATFNLGVLQGLARLGLLRSVDYLSTVSGGGYIGSWLAAWIRRDIDEAAEREDSRTAADDRDNTVMRKIEWRLSPSRSPNPLDEGVRPIRFLREYSNYLTPRTGFFSADTWTMIGIYVRNTLLNQVIIAAVFAAILLVPRNWMWLADYLHRTSWWTGLHIELPIPGSMWPFLDWLVNVRTPILGVALWTLSTILLLRNLRQLDPRDRSALAGVQKDQSGTPTPKRFAHPWVIHIGVVVPWLLMAALTAQSQGEWLEFGELGRCRSSAWVAIVVSATMAIVLLLGRADRCWVPTDTGKSSSGKIRARLRQAVRDYPGVILGIPAIVGSAASAGALAGGFWWLLTGALRARPVMSPTEMAWHLNALGTPALMIAMSLAIVVMLGMLGRQFPDEHREWWSRLRTVIHFYAVGWLVWFLVVIYVPWGIHATNWFGIKSGLGAIAVWAASTLLGVLQGSKAEAEAKRDSDLTVPPGFMTMALRWGAFVAPYVFVVGLVLGMSVAIDALYARNTTADPVTAYWDFVRETTTSCWTWTLVCALVAVLFSLRVDINEFSIHHFYKNRLVRCYLGASHAGDRKPDWFTGFDPKDDLPLRRFDCEDRSANKAAADAVTSNSTAPYVGPYPILNCALNLVGGKDLAWQERKATSFVFTPKYCGYDVDRSVLAKGCEQFSDGYVQTRNYYNTDGGPLLGMATAISGAAANPNMGRASSPALGFLMTVFNVRLGWWIGNPRYRTSWKRCSPQFGLLYTFVELFGMTDDQRKFVNLSDGGHFDNLGVYELIRRNCRYIVVCDAGQDDRMIYEDLGMLVRRCRMDFGVEIDIAVDRIRHREEGRSQAHCVVGTIKYLNMPLRVGDSLICEDGSKLRSSAKPAYETGYLVYIKPSLTGDEPQDVLEYARRSARFPHQSTANQWFAESQFESYRTLGMHIAEQTFSRYKPDDTYPVKNIDDFFEDLYLHWHPPSPAIVERSTEHAAEYSRIMELIRSTLRLQSLDETLFDALMSRQQPALSQRDEFYICNALIQLIENVYADLNLECNWAHPHVSGWMEIFSTWAQQPAFRRTWRVSKQTYAERFRCFYKDRLAGEDEPSRERR